MPRVTFVAPGSPSAWLRLDAWLRGGVIATSLLLATGLVGVTLSEWRRRKRIGAARPMGKDSAEFEAGLALSKQQLDVTPREVVRFTNASRFLCEVVTSTSEAEKGEAPLNYDDFFALMVARWKGGPDPKPALHADSWLIRQLDVWLPALRLPTDDEPNIMPANRERGAAKSNPAATRERA